MIRNKRTDVVFKSGVSMSYLVCKKCSRDAERRDKVEEGSYRIKTWFVSLNVGRFRFRIGRFTLGDRTMICSQCNTPYQP